MNLVSKFNELIQDDWKLERDNGEWQLKENSAGASHTLLRIRGLQSLAFTLDKQGKDPWPYIKSNTALIGMRSVCDALAVVHADEKPLVVAVEMKSSNSGKADAMKQLARAKHFVDWLVRLLEENGHWHGNYDFCGVISLKPRRQSRKGTTLRTPLPSPEQHPKGFRVITLENHPRLDLSALVSALA